MSSVNGQAKAGAPAQDILRMEHITKIYGNGFIANNGIDFRCAKARYMPWRAKMGRANRP